MTDGLKAQVSCPTSAVPGFQFEPSSQHWACALIRLDLACNMCRFCGLALATSLFGEVSLVRQWGRVGNQGQSQTDWYESQKRAETACRELLVQKRRQGCMPTSKAGASTSSQNA